MTTPRFDPYTLVHKGQRKKLFELATAAGQLAADDREGRGALVADIQAMLDSLTDHADAEDAYFGPLYRNAAPDTGARLAGEHAALGPAQEILRGIAMAALAGGSATHDLALYRELGRFTGAYLAHLDAEERSLPELWAMLDDDAIARAQSALVASHPTTTVQFNLRNMLPAASAAERVAFLSNLRRNMPAPAFAGVRNLVGTLVPTAEWAAVDAS